MFKKRLTDNHPVCKRLAELWEHADRLGLSIHMQGSNCTVTDMQTGQTFYVEDCDDSNQSPAEFPWPTEVKLTFYER